MLKLMIILALFTQLWTGCGTEDSNISYDTVVCEYTIAPTCWTVIDCIYTHVRINADNTVEIYCTDFLDRSSSGEEIRMDYIYGETIEITEEAKQSVIDALEKNRIAKLSDCGDENSCDGSYEFIALFDENEEAVHSCGGLNPSNKRFNNASESIMDALPEGTYKMVKDAATEYLITYLLENYPGEYQWLEEE